MGYRIEVRDRNLNRIGELDTWMKMDLVLRLNRAGSWQLLVRDETPQAKLLEKGGGIAVWMDERPDKPIFSGQIETFQKYWTTEQHTGVGSVYVGGKCDNKIPYGYLALPGTTGEGDARRVLPVDQQWKGEDRRTYGFEAGQALWVEYDFAFGNRGLPGRKVPGVNMGPPPATAGVPPKVGKLIGGTLRYDSIGTLAENWTKEGEIAYQFLWNPDTRKIELTVFTPADKSMDVRFSPELGNLREYIATLTAPRVTRVVVACQGEGQERFIKQFPEKSALDDDSQPLWVNDLTADEREWGFVIEQFVDRRDVPLKTGKDGGPELVTKLTDGKEDLGTDPDGKPWKDKPTAVKHYLDSIKSAAEGVFKENQKNGNFQVYPIETPQCRFGRDYYLGDKVSVDIDGETYVDVVREVTITVEDGGRVSTVTPKIGEQGTGEPLNLYKHVSELREKLRKLEARL
ncbi:Gp37-like protein [Streptomyces sp. NPDC003952]